MLYELKKIVGELYVKVLIGMMIIATIAVTLSALLFGFSAYKSANSDEEIKGTEAIKILKNRYSSVNDKVTVKKLNKVIKYYKSFNSDEAAEAAADIKYPGMVDLLNGVYSGSNDTNGKSIRDLKNANDFYKDRIKAVKLAIEENQKRDEYFSPYEKKAAIKIAKKTKTPFNNGFNNHWKLLYTMMPMLFILLALISILISVKFSAYEKDRRMNIVLSGLITSRTRKVGQSKAFALGIFITGIFFVSMIISSSLFFANTGFDAWGSNVQLRYITSLYNFTFGGVYLIFMCVGWLSVVSIGLVSFLLGLVLRKTNLALVIMMLLFIVPSILIKIGIVGEGIRKILLLQPLNAFLVEKNILSFHVYNLGVVEVLTANGTTILAILVSVISFVLIPKLFSRNIRI